MFAGLDFEGSNFIGDFMVLMAAVVLGMSSTLMEGLNNQRTVLDYISKMGLGALIPSVICMLAFEIEEIKRAPWQGIMMFLIYGVLNFGYVIYGYTLIERVNAVYYMLPNVLAPLITFPVDFIFFDQDFEWW